MPQCEELSDFARTMTEFLLASKGMPEEEPLLSTLHRAFSSLEKTLRQGGLCADILPDDAASLIKAQLAAEHSLQTGLTARATALVVADKNHLYLARDFAVESTLARKIAFLSEQGPVRAKTKDSCDEKTLSPDLAAVRRLALTRPFCVVFGGPGTGKTTCLAGILETLFEENGRLVVFLAAPTGKAAARMREALEASAKHGSAVFPHLAERLKRNDSLALPARTLHRWLYAQQDSGEKPSPTSPLNCDLFVLDEASMLDARLAEKLLRVIDPKRTRVIFLGDPFQLRSVGPGSVFADLCALGRTQGFAGELKRSFRFNPTSGVGIIAHAVNRLARQRAHEEALPKASEPARVFPGTTPEPVRFYLTGPIDAELFPMLGLLGDPDNRLYSLSSESSDTDQALPSSLKQWIAARIRPYAALVAQGDATALLNQSQRFRILCAMREGPDSVNAVNDYAVTVLRKELSRRGFADTTDAGRIIIIRKNDDDSGLYNGDMGVVLPAKEGSVTQVIFPGGADGVRCMALSLLPEYETAFAITIHQSQGSEYEDVALVLPTQAQKTAGTESLVTNELFYTGITRVKDTKDSEYRITAYGKLAVFSSSESLKTALISLSQRKTGFKWRLIEAFEKDSAAA